MKSPERDLERELRFHWEEHVAALIAAGLTRAAAERRARLELGPESAPEYCRDVRPRRWLDDLARDLRHGLRQWRRRPAFAAAALATLALGIAASTVMSALVGNVLLKPVAFPHPGRLVTLMERTSGPPSATALAEGWGDLWSVAYPNYRDLAAASRTLALGAWHSTGGIVSSPGAPAYVDAAEVTASLLPVLGVAPAAGREFTPAEDRRDAAPVALLATGLARARFGSAAAAVGRALRFNGKLYTIVGVLPPGFDLAGYPTPGAAAIFTPLRQDARPALRDRGMHLLDVAARLRPGLTLAQARRELALLARRLAARYPATNAHRGFQVSPWRPQVGAASTTLWLLFAAAGLVLLLAVSNIAGLLLARTAQRGPELALRAALGAGRGRLARQCLAESLLLGLGGGALGVGLAALGLRPFLALWPGGLPRAAAVGIDARVLALALLLSLGCALLFGLAPAWRARRLAPEAALRGASRALAGGSRRLQRGFAAAQVALALILLVAAATLGQALLRLSAAPLGVTPRHAVTMRVALPAPDLANPARARAAWRALLVRVRALPGVTAAATVDTVPLREGNNTAPYWTGVTPVPARSRPTALATCVSSGYFRAMGIPLLAGRPIDAGDRAATPPVAVIDGVLARHAFGDRSPLGQQIHIGFGRAFTIVGVVQHVRYWGAADDASPVRDQVYYAFRQLPRRFVPRWSELMSLGVRAATPTAPLLPALRRVAAASGAALYEVRTLRQLARASLDQQRFLLLLFALFSAVALVLAAVGVYGVEAQLAAQRMPELGVRAALGATRGDILWLVLRQSLGVAAAGIAAGGAAAWAVSRLVRGAVPGVGAAPPGAVALAALALLTAVAAASLPPARRASRADPLATLRQN
jgi:predicted permease